MEGNADLVIEPDPPVEAPFEPGSPQSLLGSPQSYLRPTTESSPPDFGFSPPSQWGSSMDSGMMTPTIGWVVARIHRCSSGIRLSPMITPRMPMVTTPRPERKKLRWDAVNEHLFPSPYYYEFYEEDLKAPDYMDSSLRSPLPGEKKSTVRVVNTLGPNGTMIPVIQPVGSAASDSEASCDESSPMTRSSGSLSFMSPPVMRSQESSEEVKGGRAVAHMKEPRERSRRLSSGGGTRSPVFGGRHAATPISPPSSPPPALSTRSSSLKSAALRGSTAAAASVASSSSSCSSSSSSVGAGQEGPYSYPPASSFSSSSSSSSLSTTLSSSAGPPSLSAASSLSSSASSCAAALMASSSSSSSSLSGSGAALSTAQSVLSAQPPCAKALPPVICNCKHTHCLKLYCECFKSQRYCSNCNCVGCSNNKDNEKERMEAINATLERDPNSFQPKIVYTGSQRDSAVHMRGCRCKRTGCLKKYCECFQNGIHCSENCKCQECKNFGGSNELGSQQQLQQQQQQSRQRAAKRTRSSMSQRAEAARAASSSLYALSTATVDPSALAASASSSGGPSASSSAAAASFGPSMAPSALSMAIPADSVFICGRFIPSSLAQHIIKYLTNEERLEVSKLGTPWLRLVYCFNCIH